MKERIISVCILLLAAVTVCLIVIDIPRKNYAQPATDFSEAIRNGEQAGTLHSEAPAATGSSGAPAVAEEVIRLHILADSDSEDDQAIKLALRDVLLPYLHAATLDAETKEDAMARLSAQCDALTKVANTFLSGQNTGYTATVSVEQIYFPIRIYGSQTYLSADAVIFPPGFYDSVQVVLGSGKGHNWWCLAYPSLCFIDASYDYVPKESDTYKIKIGTTKKTALEKLFYGRAVSSPADVSQETGKEPQNSDSGEITLYFGSKLWEIIRNMLKSID